MSECPRPQVEYPHRVPLKVIGRESEFSPEAAARLIASHLGAQPALDAGYKANHKGPYISYTFWVTLPDETSERPLREAFSKLPGYVMQL